MVASGRGVLALVVVSSLLVCRASGDEDLDRKYAEIRRLMGQREYAQAFGACTTLVCQVSGYLPGYEILAELGYYGGREEPVTRFLFGSIDSGRDVALSAYGLGVLRYCKGDFKGATDAFGAALEYGAHQPDVYKNLEYAYEKANGSDDAVRHFSTMSMRHPREAGYAYAAALAHWSKRDHGNAIVKLEDAIALAPQEPRFREAKAAALLSSGEEERGLRLLRACLRDARNRRDLPSCQFIQSHLLNAEIEWGDWNAAVVRARQMVAEAKEYALLRWLGWGLKKLSDAEFQLGSYNESLHHAKLAFELSLQNQDIELANSALVRQISCQLQIGENISALVKAFRRLEISWTYGPPFDVAYAIYDLALVYHELGLQGLALDYAIEGLIQAESLPAHQPLLAQVRAIIGLIHERLGNRGAALLHLRQALSILPKGRKWDGHRANIMGSLASVFIRSGALSEARKYLGESWRLMARIRDRRERCYILNLWAEYYLHTGDLDRAEALLYQSYNLSRAMNHKPLMRLNAYALGRVYEVRGNRRIALDWFSEASKFATDMRVGQFIPCETEGVTTLEAEQKKYVELLCQEGKYEEALNVFNHFRALSNSASSTIWANSVSCAGMRVDTLKAQIRALRVKLSARRERHESDLSEERVIFPLLATIGSLEANLLDLSEGKHKVADAATGSARLVSDIRAKLIDKETALIQFAVFDNAVYVFIVREDTFICRPIEVHRDCLVRHIRSVSPIFDPLPRSSLLPLSTADFNGIAAHSLYRLLFPEAELDLLGIRKLLIVTDSELTHLPFESLVISMEGRNRSQPMASFDFLISRFQVCYVASVTEALERKRDEHPLRRQMLVICEPRMGVPLRYQADPHAPPLVETTDHEVRLSLPGTRQEVEDIMNTYQGKADIVLGEVSSHDWLLARLGQYQIVHIAGHGENDLGCPMYSRLTLPASSDSSRSNWLYAHELLGLGLHAELFVLSCCNTASVQGTSITNGFVRGLMLGGVRRVIASLWNVDDHVSALFMRQFYRHLSTGCAPSEAMQLAKLDLIASGYADPFHWAPFILVGDPSPLPPGSMHDWHGGQDAMAVLILALAVTGAGIAYVWQSPALCFALRIPQLRRRCR